MTPRAVIMHFLSLLLCISVGVVLVPAETIELRGVIEAQFGPFMPSTAFDEDEEVFLMESGRNMDIKCKELEPMSACIVSIFHDETPIVRDGLLVDELGRNGHYSYQSKGLGESFQFLRIWNLSLSDSGNYSCLCRKPKPRIQFMANRRQVEVLYRSSIGVKVVTSLPPEASCQRSSADVILGDEFEMGCIGHDVVLARGDDLDTVGSSSTRNGTTRSGHDSAILEASLALNNTRFCCVGESATLVCSFPPLVVHERLQTSINFLATNENSIIMECVAVPRTNKLSWEIATSSSLLGASIDVLHSRTRSEVTLRNLPTVNDTVVEVSCKATLGNHTAVSVVFIENGAEIEEGDSIEARYPPGGGIPGETVRFSFTTIYAIMMSVLVVSTLLTFLLLMSITALHRPAGKGWKRHRGGRHSRRDSVLTAVTTVTVDDGCNESESADDPDDTASRTRAMLESFGFHSTDVDEPPSPLDDSDSTTSRHSDESGWRAVDDKGLDAGSQDKSDQDEEDKVGHSDGGREAPREKPTPLPRKCSLTIDVTTENGDETSINVESITVDVPGEESAVPAVVARRPAPAIRLVSSMYGSLPSSGAETPKKKKKKVRFASKSVSIRVGRRRSSLFDNNSDDNTGGGDSGGERPLSLYEDFPLSRLRNAESDNADNHIMEDWLKSRSYEDLPLSSPGSPGGTGSDGDTEPIYALPEKLMKKGNSQPETGPKQVWSVDDVTGNLYISGHIVNVNNFASTSSSPSVKELIRANEMRNMEGES